MKSCQAKNVTETATVNAHSCNLIGFYVNSTTGGTIIIHDTATTAANAISGTITPAIGWHFFPASFPTSIHVTVANTIDATFVYNPVPKS